MIIVLIGIFLLFTVIVYSAIRVGDEHRFLDEHHVSLTVYTYYNQGEFKIIAEWPEDPARPVVLHVYTRSWDRMTESPQVKFLPHAILRTYKTTGEVYDWFEY